MRILTEEHDLVVEKIEFNSNNSQIIRSFLFSKSVTFWEQTSEMVEEYFSPEELLDINDNCAKANDKMYGDHAVFYLIHKR